MPLKNYTNAIVFALATAALTAGMGCARKVEPPPQPVSVDDVQSDYKADMQSSLTAYFNTLKLTKGDIKPGLTLVWQSKDNLRVDGTLTATGETSPNGCPVWKVVEHLHWHDDSGTRSTGRTMALCP